MAPNILEIHNMKITKHIIAVAAALGLFSACVKEDMTRILPFGEIVAPVLENLPDEITVTPENMGDKVTFNWSAADYGVKTQVNYSIVAVVGNDTIPLYTGINALSSTQTLEALNQRSITPADAGGLGLAAGQTTPVTFLVGSMIGNGFPVKYSNGSTVKVTPVEAEREYPMIYVIGNFNGWKDGRENLSELFDFNADGETYSGLIGFDGKAADGFKIRGTENGWDDKSNWGFGDVVPEPEAATAQLVCAGSSSDMKIYARNFYLFTFNTSKSFLTVVKSFDQIGIVGSAIGSWDNDVVMNYHPLTQKFFADVTLVEGQMKFRFDGNWATPAIGLAADATAPVTSGKVVIDGSSKDIKVPAGNFRIYLNMNDPDNITFSLNAKDYGTDPGVPAQPDPKPAAWSLIGTIGGTNWDTDTDLTNAGGDIWVVRNVALTASDEFKIRADHKWDEAYGGPEENAQSTIDPGNPYGVFKPTLGTAFEAKDKNIAVGAAGNYDVTFDYAAKTILIEAHREFPAQLYMIGDEFSAWNWNDPGVVEMTPVLHNPDWGADAPGQFWTVRYFTAGKGFKFCAVKAWNGDFNSLTTNDGFTVVNNNCTVAEDGFYLVHIDLKNSILHVEPARVYGMGDCFGGWDAEKESALFKTEGKTLKATIAADGELRMFVASRIATSEWWTREFIVLDGRIAYRGNGGEQQRVKCTAGQVVTLDPNARTGSIQ